MTDRAEAQISEFGEKKGLTQLPDWKRIKNPFERIAELAIDNEDKDKIVLWWKLNDKKLAKLEELAKVSTSINLPKNEQSEILSDFNQGLTSFKVANEGLLGLTAQANEGVLKKIIRIYSSTFGASDKEAAAHALVQIIDEFNDSEEDLELDTSVGKAIIESRGVNPDENMIRRKAAQHVFKEMFDELAAARIAAVNDIDSEVSGIIDAPFSEKSELTSAFLSEPWNGETRRKMLKNYNKLKRVMEKLETDTEYKIALNTLWKWANGELPKDASVFKILDYAENLQEGVIDTLADAWEQEAERKEDEEEE